MNLSSIFSDSNTGAGADGLGAFDSTPPAPEMEPLPPNVYVAVVVHGELVRTRSGCDGYRVKFRIVEGPYAGRFAFRTWSFSERALPYARRDLAALGLTSSAKLLGAFPEPGREYRVKLWVALQRGDDGRTFNDVKRVQLITVGPTTAPPTDPPAPTAGPTTARPTTAGLPPELRRFGLGKREGGDDDR
jgi:hypothetical protein